MIRTRPSGSGQRGGISGRLLIAAAVAIFALITYFSTRQTNPVTEEVQNISLTPEQEITLGQQAAPEMAAQYGGLSQSQEPQARVDQIGRAILRGSEAGTAPYPFEFHVLADPQTINAFALPGGQVFITEGLINLLETEGELAGVLSHEIVHVVGRHSAEQIARAQLAEGLTGAAVLATYDPDNPSSQQSAAMAQLVAQAISMKYGRDDELEADRRGVGYMAGAGYDPRAMIGVMQKLDEASQGASPPEFLSTHPDPGRRIEQIESAIAEQFPQGLPEGLKP
ncbi:MAG: M48 family metalloprotease [Chloroflexales bacterium]|nr:M48 family metalloprotease [Chloroflexales bacterium]